MSDHRQCCPTNLLFAGEWNSITLFGLGSRRARFIIGVIVALAVVLGVGSVEVLKDRRRKKLKTEC